MHEKQQQNRWAEVVELLEELVVPRQVDIDRAHRHAAEQRRCVQQRAHAAEGENHRDGDDQPVVGGALRRNEQLQQPSAQPAQHQHAQIDRNRPEHAAGVEAAGRRRQRDGNGDAVLQQSHHVVERHHLQQRLDERPLRPGLPDRHDHRSRRRRRGQRRQHNGKRQLQVQHPVGRGEHEDRRHARFQYRDQHHLRAVFPQDRQSEEFARAERDERQRDVGQKVHAADDPLRHQLQAERADQNAREDIGRDVRQLQELGQPRHEKAEKQHKRDGYDDRGDRRRILQRRKEMKHALYTPLAFYTSYGILYSNKVKLYYILCP